MLAALEKGKKAKPQFTKAGYRLAAIEDSIIATQQRIDEEEFGKRLPPELPLATYDLPRGFPKAKYQRFADQTKRNAEDSLDELVQSLFNMTYESRLSSARQALAAAERKQDVKKLMRCKSRLLL